MARATTVGAVAGLGSAAAAAFLFRSRLCRLFGCPEERIAIASPAPGSTITSPVSIAGRGRATQHNQLAVEVRDSANAVIGTGSASVSGVLGQPGPFTATVSFSSGTSGSPGHIQVFDSSPATGAVTHLASVQIRFA